MKKSLLVGLMALSTSLSGYAFEAGEYVYAPQGRFKISSSNNLCTNSTCAANFDGWTAISATAETTPDQVFYYDGDKGSFHSLTNVAGEGMYYKFNVPNNSGTYVVSFKLRQETPAYPYSTNVLYSTSKVKNEGSDTEVEVNTYGTTAAGTNYISVFGNKGGFTSNVDFMSFGKAVMIPREWETVAFAIVGDGTTRDYYLTFAGMDPKVEISDVQIQEASQVADLRKRDKVLQFVNSIINAKEWPESDEYLGVKETVEMLNSITDDSSVAELDDALTTMDEVMSTPDKLGFLDIHMDNFLASCAANTVWANTSSKGQKLTTIGDWTFDSNRWFHCDSKVADEREKMRPYLYAGNFGYSNGMIGDRNAKLVKTLQPGVYVFSMEGRAFTQYKHGGNYLNNEGMPTGRMELYIKSTAGSAEALASNAIDLPVVDFAINTLSAVITEPGEYEIGVNLTQSAPEGYTIEGVCKGGSYCLMNPQLYCSLDGYNAAQLAYIDKVRTQINAAVSAYEKAQTLLDDATLPWMKKEMADTMAVMKPRVDFYNALTDEEIINGFVDPVSGVANNGYADMTAGEDPETGNPIPTYNAADSIMNNGVRPMQYFNNTYTKVNSIFVNLNTSINLAKQTVALPIYSTSTGKPALETAITTAESLYKDKAANGSYVINGGEEVNADSVAVVNGKVTLDDAVATFKASVPAENITTLVDIDFSGEAVLDKATSLYSIAGNNGSMEFSYFTTTAPTEDKDIPFQTGIDNNGVRENADVLRVGNGTGTVVVDPAKYSGKLVRVTFDYYFGYPNAGSAGFYLQNEADEDVAALFFSLLGNAVTTNTFGFDVSKLYDIKNVNDLDIYVEKNKTSFEIVLDYISNTMYAVATNTSKGISMSETKPLPGEFTKFIVKSDYKNYHSRRCWFDNLKIETVAVDKTGVAGVTEVSEAADDAIYNVAGQKVSAPVKGQIYVKKGAAFVK